MRKEEADQIKKEIKQRRLAKCDKTGLIVAQALEAVMEIIDNHTEPDEAKEAV